MPAPKLAPATSRASARHAKGQPAGALGDRVTHCEALLFGMACAYACATRSQNSVNTPAESAVSQLSRVRACLWVPETLSWLVRLRFGTP